jgi:AcrR family transcriptional regulator
MVLPEWNNPGAMQPAPRRLRADAERNRRRLLDAATEMFCERGLDVGVGEIAERAGVGRGTVFRNFPSKEHLIAAIVVERMRESADRGRTALERSEPGQALFELIDRSVGLSQTDRALFEALDDDWLANDEIRAAHDDLLDVLGQVVARGQEAGSVRPDVSAVDVLMMVKGVCEASRSFAHLSPDVAARQLDLVRAALSPAGADCPLRGTPPNVEDLKPARSGAAVASPPGPGAQTGVVTG